MSDPRCAVAIPARNEAARIGRCLDALNAQTGAAAFCVVVLANNCDDATAAIAAQPRGLDIRVSEACFPVSAQNAGTARRAAMASAAALAPIVLTTDADCVPDADWISAHLAAFAAGVDAVAGRVSADWEELRQQPEAALRIGALEWEYLALIAQAEALFDPRVHDPCPRHAQRCGANLAITSAMLDKIGGVPPVPVGEDRALLAAVERVDGSIRFDRAPHVTASARTDGRAAGGMAAALTARLSPDYRCDDQFEPAAILVRRWQARRAARTAWARGEPGTTLDGVWFAFERAASFGANWDALVPIAGLDNLRVSPDQLPREIDRLQRLIADHG